MQTQVFVRFRLLPSSLFSISPSLPVPSPPIEGSLSQYPIPCYLPQEAPHSTLSSSYPLSPTQEPHPIPRKSLFESSPPTPPPPAVLGPGAPPPKWDQVCRPSSGLVATGADALLRLWLSGALCTCWNAQTQHTCNAHTNTNTHMPIQKVEMCQIETDIAQDRICES